MEDEVFSGTVYNFLKNAGAFSYKICDISKVTCANEHRVSAVLNRLHNRGIVVKDDGNPPKWRVNKRSLNYADGGSEIHRPKLQSSVQNFKPEPNTLGMFTSEYPHSAQFYNSYNDISAPEFHRGPTATYNNYSQGQNDLLPPTTAKKNGFRGKKPKKIHFPRVQGSRYFGKNNFRTKAGKQNFQKSAITKPSPPHPKSRSQKPSNHKPKKELIATVLGVLRGSDHPMKTIDLAHRLNMRTTAAVNPTLYFMQRDNLISRVNISPPTWSIIMDQSTSEMNANIQNASANLVPKTEGQSPIESTSMDFDNSNRQMIDFLSEDGVGCRYVSSDASSDISSIDPSDILSVPGSEVLGVPSSDVLSFPHNDMFSVPCTGVLSTTEEVFASCKRPSRTVKFECDNSEIQDCNVTDVSSDDACIDNTASFKCMKYGLVSESSGGASDKELMTSLSASIPFDDSMDDTIDPDVIVEASDVDELGQDEHGAGCNSASDQVPWNGVQDQHDTRIELSRRNVLSVLSSFMLASATCDQVASELSCSPENVESILRELEALKFTSKIRNSPVWVLTREGERALKSVNIIDGEFVETHGDKPLSPKTLRKASALLCDVPKSTYLRSRGRGMTAYATLTQPGHSNGSQLSFTNGSMHSEDGPRSMLADTVSKTSQKPLRTADFSYDNVETEAFKPPPTPCELLGIQLKQTTISPSSFASAGSQGLSLAASNTNSTCSFSHSMLAISQPAGLPVIGASNILSSIKPEINVESFAVLNKNPISALMEYAQSRHQEARITVENQKGPAHKPTFYMVVHLGKRKFPAIACSNKKEGRTEAADTALRVLMAEGQYQMDKMNQPSAQLSLTMTHFDNMAALSHQAFNAIIAAIPENFSGRKVMAAIILKKSDSDNGTVISVGSGNRCITGQQLSLEGNTVNDSHAEIIARRGFLRYLYRHLCCYQKRKQNELFEESSSGKLKVCDGLTFHLYISTAPCGDGALFSPRDTGTSSSGQDVDDRSHYPTFTSSVQGILRTKMEGGEGTIPVEPSFTMQTFDGIQRGERLRTMSCTDKICRWNTVGIQGALLSHVLDPIYLDSLTLGFLYDHGHLARACCCRLARGDPHIDTLLPSGYRLNHPWLGRVTACEPSRETQKTKAISINWSLGDERAEVTDGVQGLCHTGVEKCLFSRLSKKNFYDHFKAVCQRLRREHLFQESSYFQAKQKATDFQEAKRVMLQKFTENKLGIWVPKPVEEEMFN